MTLAMRAWVLVSTATLLYAALFETNLRRKKVNTRLKYGPGKTRAHPEAQTLVLRARGNAGDSSGRMQQGTNRLTTQEHKTTSDFCVGPT